MKCLRSRSNWNHCCRRSGRLSRFSSRSRLSIISSLGQLQEMNRDSERFANSVCVSKINRNAKLCSHTRRVEFAGNNPKIKRHLLKELIIAADLYLDLTFVEMQSFRQRARHFNSQIELGGELLDHGCATDECGTACL